MEVRYCEPSESPSGIMKTLWVLSGARRDGGDIEEKEIKRRGGV